MIDLLEFAPILKRLVWGGRNLGTLLRKPIGPEADYAESWEVSDHGDDVSRVIHGAQAGQTLRQILAAHGDEVLGSTWTGSRQFPLLVKFLDARQSLSVQVHPSDVLAHRLANDNGKSECWVIVSAEPGSSIYAGLKPGVTHDMLARAMDSGEVEPLLHRFEAKPGQCVFIPAGTVHAIGAGIVLAEVQQMSDTTFRIFDWGRLGSDGKPRQLHKEYSLLATDFERGPVEPVRPRRESVAGGFREQLVACDYFQLERYELESTASLETADRFAILIGLGGEAGVKGREVEASLSLGRTVLAPADLDRVEMTRRGNEPATILVCRPGQ